MPFQVSPGVRVREFDRAATTPPVGLNVSAVGGLFEWGPVEEATLVTSVDRLEHLFGRPKNRFNIETWFTAFSYLAYTPNLYVSRGLADNARNAVAGRGSVSKELATATALGGTWTQQSAIADVTIADEGFLSADSLVIYSATDPEINVGDKWTITVTVSTTNTPYTTEVEAVSVASGVYTITLADIDSLGIAPTNTFAISVTDKAYAFASTQYTDASKDTDTGGIGDVVIKNEDAFRANAGFDDRVKFVSRWPGEKGNSIEVHVCDNKFAWGYSSANLGDNSYWLTVTNGATTVTVVDADGTAIAIANTPDDIIDGRMFVINGVETTLNVASDGTVTITGNYTGTSGTYAATTKAWDYAEFIDGEAPGQSYTVENSVDENGDAYTVNDEMHIVVVDRRGAFRNGQTGTILERWAGLSRYEEAKDDAGTSLYYKDYLTERSQYIWAPNDLEEAINGNTYTSDDLDTLSGASNDEPYFFKMVGGNLGTESGTGTAKANESNASLSGITAAYDVFTGGLDLNFIMTGKSRKGHTLATYIHDNVVKARNDVVQTVSPDYASVVNNPNQENEAIRDFYSTLASSSYMVFDSGYKLMYDRYNDKNVYVPLNGDVAGLMSITSDPWISPGGRTKGQIRNILGLAYNPDARAERDLLYTNRVNPVITRPGQGFYMYGDKTALARNSAFNRINVRRLFITLEKVIAEIAEERTLFELNNEATRTDFRNTVDPFLRNVRGRGGVTDFYLRVDGTNNNAEVIDANEFVGDIFVKAPRSINFSELNFTATRTGVEFTEIAG